MGGMLSGMGSNRRQPNPRRGGSYGNSGGPMPGMPFLPPSHGVTQPTPTQTPFLPPSHGVTEPTPTLAGDMPQTGGTDYQNAPTPTLSGGQSPEMSTPYSVSAQGPSAPALGAALKQGPYGSDPRKFTPGPGQGIPGLGWFRPRALPPSAPPPPTQKPGNPLRRGNDLPWMPNTGMPGDPGFAPRNPNDPAGGNPLSRGSGVPFGLKGMQNGGQNDAMTPPGMPPPGASSPNLPGYTGASPSLVGTDPRNPEGYAMSRGTGRGGSDSFVMNPFNPGAGQWGEYSTPRGDGFSGTRDNFNFVDGNLFGAAPSGGDYGFEQFLRRFRPR